MTDPRVGDASPGVEVELARPTAPTRRASSAAGRRATIDGAEVELEVLRGDAGAGHRDLRGPAIVELSESTLLVRPPGRARCDEHGHAASAGARGRAMIDPVELQVLTGAPARDLRGDGRGADPLRPLGQHQGAARRVHGPVRPATARWSCRPSTFRCTWGRCRPRSPPCSTSEHAPDRSWILNDPYRGGTHLPDITVITPVFAGRATLIAFAANRAHHADVGGPTPGSMPADSRTLADEGVVIEPRGARRGGDRRAERPDAPARSAPRRPAGPARRRPGRASGGCVELHDRVGAATLAEAFAEILDYAERRTRACLAEMPGRRAHGARDVLEAREGDLEIALRATVAGDRLRWTSPAAPRSTTATSTARVAVTRSACYFAIRVLTDPDIPANAGRLPAGRGDRARGLACSTRGSPAAVVGGNVETSSRVADVVLAAFGRALGQGTMNNLTLGNDRRRLLRDDRRRTGRLRRRRRPERRARGDEQHAQHAGRGARARVPAADGRVRAAPRLGRQRAPTAAATA